MQTLQDCCGAPWWDVVELPASVPKEEEDAFRACMRRNVNESFKLIKEYILDPLRLKEKVGEEKGEEKEKEKEEEVEVEVGAGGGAAATTSAATSPAPAAAATASVATDAEREQLLALGIDDSQLAYVGRLRSNRESAREHGWGAPTPRHPPAPPPVFSWGGSLLPSIYADGRSSDRYCIGL